MTGGRAGQTHCGRWTKANPTKHGSNRLVCSKPPQHYGYHLSGWSGWMWLSGRTPGEIVRDWSCRGWVPELAGLCGRVFRGTEDAARVKGWKIGGTSLGSRDPMCPQCAKPDPETKSLLAELQRSVGRG